MSYLGVASLPAAMNAKGVAHQEGAARDLVATRLIAQAAREGNPGAEAFMAEAATLLGGAEVRRERADRIRAACVEAAQLGYHDLAAMGADAARDEDNEAARMEASVTSSVRGSHGFGYVSAREAQLLREKTWLETSTVASRERAFKNVLEKMMAEAQNYGLDTDDDEESVGEASVQIGIAADLFGGDLPVVFGEEAHVGFFKIFKPTLERLQKRLARKERSLEKAETRLEELEDAGRKGMQVIVLRIRTKALEKGIARITSKIEKLEGAGKAVSASEEESDKLGFAENGRMAECSVDELGGEVDPEEVVADEDGDDELAGATEVYGLKPFRRRRIRRRMAHLHKVLAKTRNARKRAWLSGRIRRLKKLLGRPVLRYRPRRRPVMVRRRVVPVSRPQWAPYRPRRVPATAPAAGPRYYSQVATPTWQPAAQTYTYTPVSKALTSSFGAEGDEPEVDEDFGADGHTGQVVLGYFERRADAYGADGVDNEAFGGMWDGIRAFFANIFKPSAETRMKRSDARGERQFRREQARDARGLHRPGLQASRKQLAKLREARGSDLQAVHAEHDPGVAQSRHHLKSLRKASAAAARQARGGGGVHGPTRSQAKSRTVPGAGGYLYQQFPDGTIKILKSPQGNEGTVLTGGPAWDAITAEIGPA